MAIEVTGIGEPQSYVLERDAVRWRVLGADAVGAMYGGLELAEAVRLRSLAELKPEVASPLFSSQRTCQPPLLPPRQSRFKQRLSVGVFRGSTVINQTWPDFREPATCRCSTRRCQCSLRISCARPAVPKS